MKDSSLGNKRTHAFEHQKHPWYSVEIHHQAACVQLLVAQNGKVQFNDFLADIRYLVNNGMLTKVNIFMIKGINDQYIPEIVKRVREVGGSTINVVPFIPALSNAFTDYP